jgi:hypothetical protein
MQNAATRRIRTTEGTAGTGQELKTSSTQIGKTSLETSTHPSYWSMSKAILYQTPKVVLVAAQTYLYTTRPSPGDPREHMHRAALQGLRMVGNKLTAKDEEAYHSKGTHKRRSPRCHNSPRHRSSSRQSRLVSPKYHKSPRHGGTRRSRTPTRAYDYEDDEKRWAHRALLAEFAPHRYPKVLNYPMISKNMTDPRSHHHGSQIIYRQLEYLEDQRRQQCKVYKSTSPAQLGHG